MSGLLWALLVCAAAVLVVIAGIVGLSSVLGQRHRERATAGTLVRAAVAPGA